MKKLLYFEWLHFSRSLSRPIAVLLFLLAASFGIYNGFTSYKDRMDQVQAIHERRAESHLQVYEWFDSGVEGPEDRPWVKISTPSWSMWYANHHMIQIPSPLMVYNIGQSEHFGYYKRVGMWSTAYDNDLTAEISNPEFVQLGALDFSFVWIYLMPLLLIVLTYNIKGMELDLGFMPLLKIQQPSTTNWLLQRLATIGLGMLVLLSLLVWIPDLLIMHSPDKGNLFTLWLVYVLYLLIWMVLVFLVIRFGKGQADQALKMVGIWLLLTVALPGTVNQFVLLKKPADLMMAMIEAGRDGTDEIYDREEDQILSEAYDILPELKELEPAKNDSLMEQDMVRGAYRLVRNQYMVEVSNRIMQEQEERNQIVAASYWFNPVSGFHNWLNRISNTGHVSNLEFRVKIQEGSAYINKVLTLDQWKKRKMDRASFDEYVEMFGTL